MDDNLAFLGDNPPPSPHHSMVREHALHYQIYRQQLEGYSQPWMREAKDCVNIIRNLPFPDGDAYPEAIEEHWKDLCRYVNNLGKALLREYQLQERAAPDETLTEAEDAVLREWREVHDELVYFQSQFSDHPFPTWEEFEPGLRELRDAVAKLPPEQELGATYVAKLLRDEDDFMLRNRPQRRMGDGRAKALAPPAEKPAATPMSRDDMRRLAAQSIMQSTVRGKPWIAQLNEAALKQFEALSAQAAAKNTPLTPELAKFNECLSQFGPTMRTYAQSLIDHYLGGGDTKPVHEAFNAVIARYESLVKQLAAEDQATLPSAGDLLGASSTIETFVQDDLDKAGIPRGAPGKGGAGRA